MAVRGLVLLDRLRQPTGDPLRRILVSSLRFSYSSSKRSLRRPSRRPRARASEDAKNVALAIRPSPISARKRACHGYAETRHPRMELCCRRLGETHHPQMELWSHHPRREPGSCLRWREVEEEEQHQQRPLSHHQQSAQQIVWTRQRNPRLDRLWSLQPTHW